MKLFGTIEFLKGQNAAYIELTDEHGQWQGAARVEVRRGGREALYEEGYNQASQKASFKGGRLETFRTLISPTAVA